MDRGHCSFVFLFGVTGVRAVHDCCVLAANGEVNGSSALVVVSGSVTSSAVGLKCFLLRL